MRDYSLESAPNGTAVFYKQAEIEAICFEELHKVGLMPTTPSPVRIERFIESRFKIPVLYEVLEEGVWGKTHFGNNGAEAVIISKTLAESTDRIDQLQVMSTLAHEAGHCLLHGHMYGLGKDHKHLCRDVDFQTSGSRTRSTWHEHQANMCIGPLLIPKHLAIKSWKNTAETDAHERIRTVANTFGVSHTVARIRLTELGLMT